MALPGTPSTPTYNEEDLIIYRNGQFTGVAIAEIATPIGNEIDLIELKDVNTGNKLNGDCFIWDSVNQEWTNRKLTFEDVTGFKLQPGNNNKDLLTWDLVAQEWKATDPSKYINVYSEHELVTGQWTEGQPLFRKVIEIDVALLANIEKTILINEGKGYPISSILFTKIEGFYRGEDGFYKYSSLGQMNMKLVANAIELKLTSVINHTPHIWVILEYVKPYSPEPEDDRVWTDHFNQLFQNNVEEIVITQIPENGILTWEYSKPVQLWLSKSDVNNPPIWEQFNNGQLFTNTLGMEFPWIGVHLWKLYSPETEAETETFSPLA